ncbi:hypothetical protein BDZ91DRAFT_54579 [Kalaharituber pfeilii]|nr:hypothetical protein BDZ91DRAFT_54579 [Kalaharituber pfeilii]
MTLTVRSRRGVAYCGYGFVPAWVWILPGHFVELIIIPANQLDSGTCGAIKVLTWWHETTCFGVNVAPEKKLTCLLPEINGGAVVLKVARRSGAVRRPGVRRFCDGIQSTSPKLSERLRPCQATESALCQQAEAM